MSLQELIFAKNEKAANLFAIKLNYCELLIICMVFLIMLMQNLEELPWSVYGMYMAEIIVLLGMNFYIKSRDGVGKHIKYIEIALLLMCAIWNSFIYNLIWWGYFYIPVILSTRYGNYVFTAIVGGISSVLGIITALIQIPYGLSSGYFNLNYVALTKDITINIHKGYYGLVDAIFQEHPALIDLSIAYRECLYENSEPLGIGIAITVMCAFMARYDHDLVMVEISNAEMVATIKEEERQKTILQEKNQEISTLNQELTSQIEEITSLNGQLEENQARLEESSAESEAQLEDIKSLNLEMSHTLDVVKYMSSIYFMSLYVDLENDSFVELSSIATTREAATASKSFSDIKNYICTKLVKPEFSQPLLDFIDTAVIDEGLKHKDLLTMDYVGVTTGWSKLYIIAGDRDENGRLKHAFFNCRKIHEEKALEQQQQKVLEDALEAAKAANEAKTIFLNNMSHDIRTPMNAILGFAGIMEKNMDDPEVLANSLGKIKYSGQYLIRIINDILDMARIESGSTTVDNAFFDFNNDKSNIVNVFVEEFERKKLRVKRYRDIKHPYVFLDSAKTMQICVNLISNAIKYTPDGGSLEIGVVETPAEREGYAKYTMIVKDSGIGMSKEFQEQMFDSFSRERNTTHSGVIGTGLGMSIVKKLVDLMGGTIEVESELGKGTTIRVSMEHQIVANPELFLRQGEDIASEVQCFEGKRILMAEDNELNAEIAMDILEEEGFRVERAEDGVECVNMLAKAEAGYYDLVLMDIQMPNLDGYGATEKIRRLEDRAKAGIPIIAMTANAFDEDKKKAYAAGMDGFCTKPVDLDKLNRELARVLK